MWKEINKWTVVAKNGGFSSTASGFNKNFIVRDNGIYYVAGNFRIKNANSSFVKVSIVVNSKFEDPNGLTTVYGNTTLEGTVTLSGVVQLYENDALSVAIGASAVDCNVTLLEDSTFSVVRMAQIGTVPGFHAVLPRDVEVLPFSRRRLEDWHTSGTKGLFQTLTGFSPSTGTFCAIIDGVYKFAANINVESIQHEGNSTLLLVLNNQSTLVRSYSSGTEKRASGMDGLLYLTKGDCVELRIQSGDQFPFRVAANSGFSALYLGANKSSVPAFSAQLRRQSQVSPSGGWHLVSSWSDTVSRGRFQSESDILKNNQSLFQPPASGLYYVSALLNVEILDPQATNQIYGLITVDQPSNVNGNGGLMTGKSVSVGTNTLSISGVMSLKHDQTLKIFLRQEGGGTTVIDSSSLFCVSMVTYDWPGVTATLSVERPIVDSDWIELRDWRTSGNYGTYSFDDAFSSGRYRVYQDGTYFVSCNVIMNGNESASLEALIAVDQVVDPRNGLYSYDGNVTNHVTLNVAGALKLRKGQSVSVFVRVEQSGPWTVRTETGMSVALIGAERLESEGVLGFFAGIVVTSCSIAVGFRK